MHNVVATACLVVQLFSASDKIHKTYDLEPGSPIRVYTLNGDITVKRAKDDEVEIYADKHTTYAGNVLGKVIVSFDEDDGISVTANYLEEDVWVYVDYVIMVPDETYVLELETTNGDIDIENVMSDAEVTITNGDVTIDDVDGVIIVEATNGDVSIENSPHIEEVTGVNGDIEVEIDRTPEDGIVISNTNGDIEVYVSEDIDADVQMGTTFGNLRVHDVDVNVKKKTSTAFKGRIGDGGEVIRMSTTMGDIDLYLLDD